MGRLIIVSNRVPALDSADAAGGLAVGLRAALEAGGGLWFGWSGRIAERVEEDVRIERRTPYTLATFDLSNAEYDRYYAGFANRTLWPLLHGRSDLSHFENADYQTYKSVTRKIARHLVSLIEPGDRIWVHDYHLFLLGSELRRLGVDAPLGFFLHVPFPPSDIMATLPRHTELMKALAEFDLVGFQTTNDVRNFHDYVERQLGGDIAADGAVLISGRRFVTGVFPIGIDADRIAALAASPKARQIARRLGNSFSGRLGVIGVDRLDYTKGLARRLRAFQELLSREPDLRARVFLIQVVAPSRESVPEYRHLKQELEAISGAINARYSTVDWTPVRYINRTLSQLRLTAYNRLCRVGLVTPLRDGMNLVAKEFVAAQDETDPGVLVLSRFAGAAERLTAALIVNPYDVTATADALSRALKMPLAERRARWRDLMHQVETDNVYNWRDSFLKALSKATAMRPSPDPKSGPAMVIRSLGLSRRSGAKSRGVLAVNGGAEVTRPLAGKLGTGTGR